MSEDASRIYFTAPQNLAAGATADVPNLYLLHDGQITWLASDSLNLGVVFEDAVGQSAVSPDGRTFLFRTRGDLGFGAYAETRQLYLHREGKPLVCISCRADVQGQNDVRIGVGDGSQQGMPRGTFATSVSDDGSTVAFDTADGLSPVDTNNKRDVYVWRDGKLSLLSSGRLDAVAYILGVSGDGSDVFLGTTASLVSGDVDGGDLDIYDVRAGGGFLAADQVPAAPCAGDLCQGALSPVPGTGSQGGSADFRGGGDGAPPTRNRLTVTKPGTKALATAARTGVVSLTARVSQSANVVAVLSAKQSAKGRATWRKIDIESKRLSGGRSTKLRLRLDRAAVRELRVKRRLSLRIELRAGAITPKTVSIVLRRAAR